MAMTYDEAKKIKRDMQVNSVTGSGRVNRKIMAQAETVIRDKKNKAAMYDKINKDLGVQVEQQSIKTNPDGHVAKPGEHTGPGFTTDPFKRTKKSPLSKLFGFGNKKSSMGQKIAESTLGGGMGGVDSILGAEDSTSGVVGGAMTGFSMGGPVGALIGGGLGALVGSKKAKAKREAEERKRAHEIALQRSTIEMEKGRRLQDALQTMGMRFGETLNSVG